MSVNVRPAVHVAAVFFLVLAYAFAPLGTAPTTVFSALAVALGVLAVGPRKVLEVIKLNPLAQACCVLFLLYMLSAVVVYGVGRDSFLQLNAYRRLAYIPIMLALLQVLRTRRWATHALFCVVGVVFLLTLLHALYPFEWAKVNQRGESGDHYIFLDHTSQNIWLVLLLLWWCYSYFKSVWWFGPSSFLTRIGRPRVRALFWISGALMAWACLGLAHGRTGHIALFFALVFLAWHLNSGKKRLYLGAGAILLSAVIVAFFVSSSHGRYSLVRDDISRYAKGDISNNSIGQRFEFWHQGIHSFKEKPIFGWGTGMYQKLYCGPEVTKLSCVHGWYNPHNQFILLATEHGLVGVLIYLLFLIYLFWHTRHLRPYEAFMGKAILGMLVLHSFTDSPLFVANTNHIYLFALALVFGSYRMHQTTES
jgi:O-antigen ligase